MAHHTSVMGQSDVFALVVYAFTFHGTSGESLVLNDEGALDVNLDCARVYDRLFDAIRRELGGVPGAWSVPVGRGAIRGRHDGVLVHGAVELEGVASEIGPLRGI